MIRALQTSEIWEVRQLLSDNGWASRVEDEAKFRRAIDGSYFAFVAELEGRIVGFARAISDGEYNAYISMVVVHPDYRRQGIGRALIRRMMQDGEDMTWVLRAGREGSGDFWKSLGFAESQIAMEINRAQSKTNNSDRQSL